MKFFSTIVLALSLIKKGDCIEWIALRGNGDNNEERRHLYPHYGYLVPAVITGNGDKHWCVTAGEGVLKNVKVGIAPCDFDGTAEAVGQQLWRQTVDGKFHSKLNDNKCLRAEALRSGAKIRISDCDRKGSINKLEDLWASDYYADYYDPTPLRFIGNEDLCITYQGNNPDSRQE
eukprot:scaffold45401_cov53-Attheya_sp.AAC.2